MKRRAGLSDPIFDPKAPMCPRPTNPPSIYHLSFVRGMVQRALSRCRDRGYQGACLLGGGCWEEGRSQRIRLERRVREEEANLKLKPMTIEDPNG